MRNIVLVLVVPLALLALLILFSLERQVLSPLHQQFLRDGKHLLEVHYTCPPELNGRIIRLPLSVFEQHQLYLAEQDDASEYLLIQADGVMVDRRELNLPLADDLQVVLTAERSFIFGNGQVLVPDLDDYDLYWVSRDRQLPDLSQQLFPPYQLVDRFSSAEVEDGGAQLISGDWRLHQHGAEDAADSASLTTLRGHNHARLRYPGDDWFHYHVEASFYFGLPPEGPVVDQQTLPVETDMLVIQGDPAALEVAFGWQGRSGQFVLMSRWQEGPWEVRASYQERRPPLTNWFRLGLQLRNGLVAEGFLDGVKVAEWTLPQIVRGGFGLESGQSLMACDDLHAWSLAAPRAESTLLTSLPAPSKAMLRSVLFPESGLTWSGYRTLLPLPGVFQAALQPTPSQALPEGRYRLALMPPLERLDLPGEPLAQLELRFSDGLWTLTSSPSPELSWQGTFWHLERQLERDSGTLALVDQGGRRLVLSDQAAGPLYLRVAYAPLEPATGGELLTEHLQISPMGGMQERFDRAPVQWRWIEGNFRMHDAFAAASEAHYLAGGGPGVPFLSSRIAFAEDQVHQFALALRPVTPWDAGDASFTPGDDEAFRANQGWYTTHDLNFSFCTDGVNPLSGYSVILGGQDNSESILYRRGVPVQRVQGPRGRLPAADSLPPHPRWLRFTVFRLKSRIQVFLDQELLFDFEDSNPLPGGHLGFWTLRNRFAVSGVTSLARATSIPHPHLMFVPGDAPSPWEPLTPDELIISRSERSGFFKVTSNTGAGFKGLRYTWLEPVDLHERPVLTLPLSLTGETAIHLYLQIDDASHLLRIYGPISNLKGMLTPVQETADRFRGGTYSEVDVRRDWLLHEQTPAAELLQVNLLELLREDDKADGPLLLQSVTLGNTSNTNYLLAGNGGNRAGSFYLVGIPVMRAASVANPGGSLYVP